MVYRIQVQQPLISYGEMNLRNDFKLLALEIAFLTRAYIVAVASGYGDAEAVAKKIYSMPLQYKERLQLIFGLQPAEEFLNLLSRFFVSVFTLVNALKNNDIPNVDASTTGMYKIADDMAAYFTKVNPFWNEIQWKNLLYTYANLTIQELVAFLSGDFEKDLDVHDRLVYLSLIMGDYIAEGILEYLAITQKREPTTQCFNM